MLWDNKEVIAYLRDMEYNTLAHYNTSHWFESYCTTLEMLGETLYLDDVVSKDETTHVLESHVIDEVGS